MTSSTAARRRETAACIQHMHLMPSKRSMTLCSAARHIFAHSWFVACQCSSSGGWRFRVAGIPAHLSFFTRLSHGWHCRRGGKYSLVLKFSLNPIPTYLQDSGTFEFLHSSQSWLALQTRR
uniref:Secreted protein n=1 Tax=Ascaris lumbricoides TaxID=6252 RepID=A0A0M3I295_ASCLU